MGHPKGIWWSVKVYDEQTGTSTTLSKWGDLDSIIKELETDGLWQFVSAKEETIEGEE